METDLKNQLLIGALGAAVLCAAGYGLYRESKHPAAQGTRNSALGSGSLPDSESPVPGRAALQIETDQVVLPGSAGHRATALGGSGLRLEWSIKGGTLESGTDGDTAFWTAGGSGEVVLVCRGYGSEGLETTGASRISIKILPVISRFDSVPQVILPGSKAQLGWTAKDFKTLVLNPGNRDVSGQNGPGFEVQPAETTTYTLTATGPTGESVTRELTLKVQPSPQILSLRAEPKAGSPDVFTVIGEFKDGRAELSDGSAVIARGEASPLRVEVSSLKPGATLSLKVTNETGTTQTGTLQMPAAKP